ncbi:MAG: GcrA family cell cycle regulator [Henriciella sp.]|jgi:GcrA cell cycle regulator
MSKVSEKTKSPKITGAAAVYSLRESNCKWPIGEPGKKGFHFCGERSLEGSPYCSDHKQEALRA